MKFDDIEQFTSHGSYEINVSLSYLVKHVNSHQERGGGAVLDLDPDFQRAHVWNDAQRMKFVEYVLRGGQAGTTLYFNCKGWGGNFEGPYVIVDGKQRLAALLKFLNNKLPIFGGYYFDEFDKLKHCHGGIKWHVNNLKTREEVLQWYLDLNEGGVVHTNDELEKVRVMLQEERNGR